MDSFQNSDQRSRPKTRTYLMIAAIPVTITGLVALIGITVQPPPGPPLATLDIESGEPFELSFVSDGNAARIWVDMKCDRCALPLEGSIAVYSDEKKLAGNDIMAGDSRDRGWGGTSRKLEEHLIFDFDAQPAGTSMTVRGRLTVGVAEGEASEYPEQGPPAPRVNLLRVTVAP